MSKAFIPSGKQYGVDLSTGKVSFSIPLVDEPGIQGASLSLSLSYSSDIVDQVTRWNHEAPTCEFGLGFDLPLLAISRDTQGTGGELDDRFYLVGDSSNPLLFLDESTVDGETVRDYGTSGYTLWKIRYFTRQEKWIITKEDGIQYTLGGIDGPAIIWGLRFGNWVGATSNAAAASPIALSWKLSLVDNGSEQIAYGYTVYERLVTDPATAPATQGSGGVPASGAYTSACYLSSISTSHGDSITLSYADKDACEFPIPSAGAFQAPSATLWLSGVDYTSATGAQRQITLVQTNMALPTPDDLLRKRVLKAVEIRNADGDLIEPPTLFDYWGEAPADGVSISLDGSPAPDGTPYLRNLSALYGALKQITSPSGGTTRYEYTAFGSKELEADFSLSFAATPPADNYQYPQIAFGGGFVVGLWSTDKNSVIPAVYGWQNMWKQTTFPAIQGNDRTKNIVAVESEHFAVACSVNTGSNLFIYDRDPNNPMAWSQAWSGACYSQGGTSDRKQLIELATGPDFVALLDHGDSKTAPGFFLMCRDRSGWSRASIVPPALAAGDFVAMSGGTNFCFLVHVPADGHAPELFLYYLDPAGQVHCTQPQTEQFGTTSGDKVTSITIDGSSAFVIVRYGLASGDFDYTLYSWSEDFQTILVTETVGPKTDKQSMLAVQGNVVDFGGNNYVARYDAGSLQPSEAFVSDRPDGDHLGFDCVLPTASPPDSRDDNVDDYTLMQYLAAADPGYTEHGIWVKRDGVQFHFGQRESFWQHLWQVVKHKVTGIAQKALSLPTLLYRRFHRHPVSYGIGQFGAEGMRYLVGCDSIYMRDPADVQNWIALEASLLGENESLCYNVVQFCDSFATIVVDNSKDSGNSGVRVLTFKNGCVAVSDVLAGVTAQPSNTQPTLTGIDCFVTYSKKHDSLDEASSFTLYRVVDGSFEQTWDAVVACVSMSDGYQDTGAGLTYSGQTCVNEDGTWRYSCATVASFDGATQTFSFYIGRTGAAPAIGDPVLDPGLAAQPALLAGRPCRYQVMDSNAPEVNVLDITYTWSGFSAAGNWSADRAYARVTTVERRLGNQSVSLTFSYCDASRPTNMGMLCAISTDLTTLSDAVGGTVQNWPGNQVAIQYASEVNPQFADANMLKPVAMWSAFQNGLPLVEAATVWRIDGGRSLPSRRFLSLPPQADFASGAWQSSMDPGADWAAMGATLASQNGVAIETSNPAGMCEAVQRDRTGRLQLASFQNGSVVGGDCLYVGFEACQDLSDLGGWTLAGPSPSADAAAHTGARSLPLGGQSLTLTSPVRQSARSVQQRVAFFVRKSDGSAVDLDDMSVTMKTSGRAGTATIAASMAVVDAGAVGCWRRLVYLFEMSLSSGDQYAIMIGSGVAGLRIDDLLIAPVDAVAQAIVYDATEMLPVASIGNNGATARSVYDGRGQRVATIADSQQPSTLFASGWAREVSADGAFSGTAPNARVEVTSGDGGFYYPLTDQSAGDISGTGPAWSGAAFAEDGLRVRQGYLPQIDLPYAAGGFALQFRIKPGTAGALPDLTLASSGWQINFDGSRYSYSHAGGPITATAGTRLGATWLVVVVVDPATRQNSLSFFVDGVLLISDTKAVTSAGWIRLSSENTGDTLVRDFIFMRNPAIAVQYLDGQGRARQQQAFALRAGAAVGDPSALVNVIDETLFDNCGRPTIQTLPSARDQPLFGFDVDFVSTRPPGSGPLWGPIDASPGILVEQSPVMDGTITTGLDVDAGGFPYAQTIYTGGALNQVAVLSAPSPEYVYTGGPPMPASQAAYYRYNDDPLLRASLEQCYARVGIADGGALAQWNATAIDRQLPGEASTRDVTVQDALGRTVLRARITGAWESLALEEEQAAAPPPTGYRISTTSYVPCDPASADYARTRTAQTITTALPITFPSPSDATTLGNTGAQTVQLSVDNWGRQIQRVDPDSGTTRCVYDYSGRLRFVLDDFGRTAQSPYFIYYTYDALGRLVNAGTAPLSLVAGGFDGLAEVTDPRRNQADWPSCLQGAPGPLIACAYDRDTSDPERNATAAGQLVSMIQDYSVIGLDAVVTESFAWDGGGRIIGHTVGSTSEQQDVPEIVASTTGYVWDTQNRLSQVAYPCSGPVVTRQYDLSGRLSSLSAVSVANAPLAQYRFEYTLAGLLQRESAELNGAPMLLRECAYDSLGNLLTQSSGALWTQSLGYKDAASGLYLGGRLVSRTDQFDASSGQALPPFAMDYDAIGRLTACTADENAGFDACYGASGDGGGFDANNNLSSLAVGQAAEGRRQFTYAPNGNRLMRVASANDMPIDLQYDAIGRLSQVGASPDASAVLRYDPLRHRLLDLVETKEGGAPAQTSFLHDGRGERLFGHGRVTLRGGGTQILMESMQGNASDGVAWLYGPDGILAGLQGGRLYTVLKDWQGSTRIIIDETGAPLAFHHYYPHGESLPVPPGSAPITFGNGVVFNQLYAGMERHPDAILPYDNCHARIYAPQIGRFLRPDPARTDPGSYVYVDADPVNYVDPDGRIKDLFKSRRMRAQYAGRPDTYGLETTPRGSFESVETRPAFESYLGRTKHALGYRDEKWFRLSRGQIFQGDPILNGHYSFNDRFLRNLNGDLRKEFSQKNRARIYGLKAEDHPITVQAKGPIARRLGSDGQIETTDRLTVWRMRDESFQIQAGDLPAGYGQAASSSAASSSSDAGGGAEEAFGGNSERFGVNDAAEGEAGVDELTAAIWDAAGTIALF